MRKTKLLVGMALFLSVFALNSMLAAPAEAARKRPCCQVVQLDMTKKGLPVKMADFFGGALPATNTPIEIPGYDCVLREGKACEETGQRCEFYYNSSNELKCKCLSSIGQ